jgi:hypothetical protein
LGADPAILTMGGDPLEALAARLQSTCWRRHDRRARGIVHRRLVAAAITSVPGSSGYFAAASCRTRTRRSATCSASTRTSWPPTGPSAPRWPGPWRSGPATGLARPWPRR